MAPYRRILSFYHNSSAICYEWCECYGYFCSPPSSDLVTVVSSPTPIQIVHKNHHITPLVIIVAVVLAAFFLLLTYFAVLIKYRRRTALGPSQLSEPDDDDDDEGVEQDTHHVWYIRTAGLDQPTIDSITICAYRSGEGLIEGTDCSVCLSEFRDGELVRLLPKCSHAFHIPCIDTWLNSHVNCPLCRAYIVAPAAGPSNLSSSPVAAPVGSSSRTDTSPGENLNLPPSESNRLLSIRETEDGNGQSGIGIVLGPESSSSILDSRSRVPSNLGDGRGNKLDGLVAVDVKGDGGLQPVRRSVSMDLSSMGSLLHRVELAGSSGDDSKKCNFEEGLAIMTREKLESCSRGASLQKSRLGMERSLSSGRGLFFLSRYGRGRNSILPL